MTGHAAVVELRGWRYVAVCECGHETSGAFSEEGAVKYHAFHEHIENARAALRGHAKEDRPM